MFNTDVGDENNSVQLPCGKCIECRIARSVMWSLRCVFEAREHTANSFITLTYEQAPISLQVKDVQKFIKRLRSFLKHKYGRWIKIKYFCAGEYGEDKAQPSGLGRPHYHLLIFGYQFEDLVPWKKNQHGDQRYLSHDLTKVWGHGFTEVGEVSARSAAYVARYTTKKINGDMADEHYKRIDFETGEEVKVKPEFMTCSKRPPIAKAWFDKYKSDLYKGYITHGGVTYPVPEYYKKLLDSEAAQEWNHTRIEQECSITEVEEAQLEIRRVIGKAKEKNLKRQLN